MSDLVLQFKLHGKRFRVAENEAGLSTVDTIFEYRLEGPVVVGSYKGGPVAAGQIIGVPVNDVRIDMRFQCVSIAGELQSGLSRATLSLGQDGRLHMSFQWSWLLTGEAPRRSVHVEV